MSNVRITIPNLEMARNIRDHFYDRLDLQFQQMNAVNQKRIKNAYTSNRLFKPKKIKNDPLLSLKNQEKKIKCVVDKLVPVNLRDICHDDAVSVFLNNQLILQNINQVKQKQLLEAYQDQRWDDAIFSDELFIQTALALYVDNEISNSEFETLLIMYQARIPLNEGSIFTASDNKYPLKVYKILDQNGEFTEDAINLFIPKLPGYMYQEFNETQVNNFRMLVKAFIEKYPSENVFFTVESDEYGYDQFADQLSDKHLHATLYADKITNNLDQIESNEKIIFSCTSLDALQLACFDFDDVVPVRGMAGELTPLHIDQGMSVGLRPGAVSYPDAQQNYSVHGEFAVSNSTKREHDNYHAQLLARQGKAVRMALLRMRNLSRTHFLAHCSKLADIPVDDRLSKVTWRLTDGEFRHYNSFAFSNSVLTSEQIVENFCIALDKQPSSKDNQVDILFQVESGVVTHKPTDLGIDTFIDMAKNASEWQAFGFNPEFLTGKYKAHYQIAKQLLPYFTDDSKHNLLVYKMFMQYHQSAQIFFKKISSEQFKRIENALEIKRNNEIGFLGLIDGQLPKKSLDSVLAFTILKNIFPIEFKSVHPDLDYEQHFELFNCISIVYLYLNQYQNIKLNVLMPLSILLVDLVEYNIQPDPNHLKAISDHLSHFISHQKSALQNSDICDAIDILVQTHSCLSKMFSEVNEVHHRVIKQAC